MAPETGVAWQGVADLFALTGRRALVTGGGTGLGRAMALALARAGADVAISVRASKADAEDVASAIHALGRRALVIEADLADAEQCERVVATVCAEWGDLDILVNNAGTVARGPAVSAAAAGWDAVMDLNARGVFLTAQAAARRMLHAGRGKIINVASMMSFQGGINVSSYAASKGAVAQLTKALANEWAPQGVNVNAIAPGYFRTRLTAGLREDPERAPAILARIPAGRWGEPTDLDGAVIFLASRASDYVHGCILNVDGGWLAR